jgi:hypothetical protein
MTEILQIFESSNESAWNLFSNFITFCELGAMIILLGIVVDNIIDTICKAFKK